MLRTGPAIPATAGGWGADVSNELSEAAAVGYIPLNTLNTLNSAAMEHLAGVGVESAASHDLEGRPVSVGHGTEAVCHYTAVCRLIFESNDDGLRDALRPLWLDVWIAAGSAPTKRSRVTGRPRRGLRRQPP